MKKLISNKNGKVAMFIAETQDDWECLELLYYEGILFGAYSIYNFREKKETLEPTALWLNKNYPSCYGILQISIVSGFASKPNDKLLGE